MINRLHALFPPTIKDETPNPLTPWSISKGLFERLPSTSHEPFRKAVVLPSDPEWRFVWTAFSHDLPNRFMIRSISCIHNGTLARFFETALINQDREASKFVPTWQDEPNPTLRAKVIERWEAAAKLFSPFTTMESDGRRHQWENVKVLPLWHGTKEEICESICESGFTYFGKKNLGVKNPGDPKNTDAGFFGSGIYFTNSARYAADIYSHGHLILSWVSMRTPFPVVSGDLKTLAGSTAYKHYNAHYAPVCAKNPSNLFEPNYFPLNDEELPHCDEIVVFQTAQALPRFWVTLELLDLYKKRLSLEPQFVEDLITHLYNLQLSSEVDRDRRIRLILATCLAKLIERDPLDDLTDEELQWYEVMRNLLDASGKVQRAVRDQLIVLSGEKPQAHGTPQSPASSTNIAAPIRSATLSLSAKAPQQASGGALSFSKTETLGTISPRALVLATAPQRGLTQAEMEEENALGIKYRDGNGVPKDYKRAFQHFKIAVDAGYAPARLNILQLLHLAAQDGNKEVVELLLANGAEVDALNLDGEKPIHLATEGSHKEVVELLIAKGAKVNATDSIGWQLIHHAAWFGNREIVEFLLACGAKINAASKFGWQPIHLAAENGHKGVVELLLAKGAEVDAATDTLGQQPIHLAAERGRKEVLELLLSKQAKANTANKQGQKPIDLAARNGHKEIVELLLAKGASEEKVLSALVDRSIVLSGKNLQKSGTLQPPASSTSPTTPTQSALLARVTIQSTPFLLSSRGYQDVDEETINLPESETVRVSVDLSLPLPSRSDITDPRTPVLASTTPRVLTQAEREAENALGIKYRDGNGVPRDYKRAFQHFKIAADAGHAAAQLELLPLAATFSHKDVEMLLANRAEVDVKDFISPIYYAANKGYKEIVELLLAEGAEADANAVIKMAANKGYKEIVELLITRGAEVDTTGNNGRQLIHYEAWWGHKEVVELLLARGAKVDSADKLGMQPIHLAAERGHKEIVELLIARGAKVDSADKLGIQPIHHAASEGHKEVVELLIARGAKVDSADKLGIQPIDHAAKHSHKEVVELLIARGAKVNTTYGIQPIHYEAMWGHKEVIELLLARGANVDAADKDGRQPIHHAASEGHKEVVELLIARGAEVDTTCNNGRQLIHYEAWWGHKEVVELLLARGAKVDSADKLGMQPIHYAAEHGHKEVVELLIARGANIDAADKLGRQPIHLAAEPGHKEVVELLIARGAKVDSADKLGRQPIYYEASWGHKEVIELLLARGAKVDAADKDGQQPIHLAAERGHKEVVELLLARGAKVDAACEERWQAIDLAVWHGHKEVVELLLARGAKLIGLGCGQLIHCAAKRGHKEVVELLLARGAKVDAKVGGDRQLIHCAASEGHKEVVELLLARGAKVDSADKLGMQPIHHAASEGHKEVVELLLARGAKVNAVNKCRWQLIYFPATKGHKEVVELLLAKGAKVDAVDKDGKRPIHFATKNRHEEIVKLLLAKGAKKP